jgi:hypothetical protein
MKFGIVPRYSDLFEEPVPELENLLEGISSELIIGLLTMMHAEIHLSVNDFSSQGRILEFLLGRQPQAKQQRFLYNLKKSNRNEEDEEFGLFVMSYVLEFMHYALINYRVFPMQDEDSTPEQDFRLLKAYVVFIEKRNEKDTLIFDHNRDHSDDFFFKNTLPMLSGQYEANHLVNPFPEMVRGIVLLNYLQFSSPYAEQVKSFLLQRGYTSSWHYVFTMTNIIQSSWIPVEYKGRTSARYSIGIQPEFEPMFKIFTMDISIYKESYVDDHKNYAGIKDKPLLKFDEECYIVLNWNFFSSKLYEGLMFDFYTYSGIKEVSPFKTFVNFKQFIGEQVTEGFLFKKLISEALKKPHSILLFDERTQNGFPDAYYREGNDVILFEIKDAFFPSRAIDTIAYTEIKDAIDEKYNQDHKGTGQLVSQLVKMSVSSFELKQGYKNAKNLTVYPVMVYTDYFFSMPGINTYLQQEFEKRFKAANLEQKFKCIKPLVFINVRFFINHIDLLEQKQTSLLKLFELFYKEKRRALKKVRRTDAMSAFFDCYKTFENSVFAMNGEIMYHREGYVKKVVDMLELTRGLPEGEVI